MQALVNTVDTVLQAVHVLVDLAHAAVQRRRCCLVVTRALVCLRSTNTPSERAASASNEVTEDDFSITSATEGMIMMSAEPLDNSSDFTVTETKDHDNGDIHK